MYMKARDAISGREGTLYATIDGKVFEVAECKSISAKMEKKKVDFRALGYRGTQHKATGWDGTGQLVIHYASSRWVKMMVDYARTGVDQYFKLQVTNDDPTAEIGKQRLTLIDVNLNGAELAKLDVESDILDQSMDFTFSDMVLNEEFSELKD
jgi:hypothetical protein